MWVSCLTSPVARDQRKICGWPGFSSFEVQVLVKARVFESGDHTGAELAQAVSALGDMMRSLTGSGLAGSVRWSWVLPPPAPRWLPLPPALIAQARRVPSGEMAAEVGARSRVDCAAWMAARRGSGFARGAMGAGVPDCAEAAAVRSATVRRRGNGREAMRKSYHGDDARRAPMKELAVLPMGTAVGRAPGQCDQGRSQRIGYNGGNGRTRVSACR